MKNNHFYGLIIAVLTVLSFTSCAKMLYGSSSQVTIETDLGRADNVNLTAVGPKGSVEINNISLPYKMKVKHDNLPLRVTLESDENIYDPFTIGAKHRGEEISIFSKALGYMIAPTSLAGLGVAINEGEGVTLSLALAALSGGLLAIGYTAETDIPDNKYYLTSSHPISSEKKLHRSPAYRRLAAVDDVYTLIAEEDYTMAEAKARWLYEQEPSGEVLYLKGVSNHYLGKYKKSLEDLKNSLAMVEAGENPGLRKSIIESIELSENARQMAKEERQRQWAEIAGGILQAGASLYQGYTQIKQNEEWQKSGISPSGVVTDPSKLSSSQMNMLLDPMYAMQQVQQQEWMEYTEFSRYNKKPDGSNFTYTEWQALKGQAILALKEEGHDILAEQQEQLRQRKEEAKGEEEEDRKRWFAKYGYKKTETATTTATTGSSTTKTRSSQSGTGTSTYATPKKKLDAEQQYKTEPVSSEDYKKVKTVTLYYRDGSSAKVKMNNVELYIKGAWYFIKIGNKYYPRCSPNWLRFRNAINYGGIQLYYDD